MQDQNTTTAGARTLRNFTCECGHRFNRSDDGKCPKCGGMAWTYATEQDQNTTQEASATAEVRTGLDEWAYCMKCGKIFDPYWSKRHQKAVKCCATCAWKNLEAFLAEPDHEPAIAKAEGWTD